MAKRTYVVGYFFAAPLKQRWYPKYFFRVDRSLNWTGKSPQGNTPTKRFFREIGLKIQENAAPLWCRPRFSQNNLTIKLYFG